MANVHKRRKGADTRKDSATGQGDRGQRSTERQHGKARERKTACEMVRSSAEIASDIIH